MINKTDKREIESVVNSEIKKFISDHLDKEMEKLVASSNSKTRKEMVELIKDSMEAVYKLLWQKRSFWKGDIR